MSSRKPKEPYVNIFARIGRTPEICRIYNHTGSSPRVLYPKLYDAAWRMVRSKRKYLPLEDELLWHKVFETYINSLPPVPPGASRDELIEHHLRVVGDIAGQIAWKRCPKSFGIWSKEAQPSLSHVGLVYELSAFATLAMFIAADRYSGKGAFSTYANFWIRKYVRLFLEEIIDIVPRTGHMGDDKPRRSVMDLLDAALEQCRLYRGKAAGGMAVFDGSLTIEGPNPGDKEIETVGTDGPTLNPGMDYLQRQVTFQTYPWIDIGSGFIPRLELPGGKASAELPREYEYEPNALDDIALPSKPVPFEHTGPHAKQTVIPAEICYLDKRCGSFNSWDRFGDGFRPKMLPRKSTPHWKNSPVIAVEYLRRHGRKPWRKPTYEEAPRYPIGTTQ